MKDFPMPASTIALPKERIFQLHAVRDTMNAAGISEVIGSLLKLARENGLADQSIPGIQIDAQADGVDITFGDAPAVSYSNESAKELAETIREYATDRNTVGKLLNLDHSFAVFRRGTGIAIQLGLESGPIKVLTHDLAADLADLIDK